MLLSPHWNGSQSKAEGPCTEPSRGGGTSLGDLSAPDPPFLASLAVRQSAQIYASDFTGAGLSPCMKQNRDVQCRGGRCGGRPLWSPPKITATVSQNSSQHAGAHTTEAISGGLK